MKRLLEVIVLFLISDIRIFIGENDSIESTIKMCRLSFSVHQLRTGTSPPLGVVKSHSVDEV